MSINDPNDINKPFMPQTSPGPKPWSGISRQLGNGLIPQEMLERLMNGMDTNSNGPSIATPKKKGPAKLTLREKLEGKLTDTRRTLDMLESAAKELDKLTLEEGDAAFHPDHGNVLIQGYYLGDATHEAIDKDWHGKILAKIVTINHGAKQILASSLLPLNETTKVLYGKSK